MCARQVTFAQVPWSVRLPITIEVLKDVDVVHWNYRQPERRGALYLGSTDDGEFRLARGQRFQVVKIEGEGQCWIRVFEKRHLLMSCPWFDDYKDHQSDVFHVVPPTPRTKRRSLINERRRDLSGNLTAKGLPAVDRDLRR